MLKLARWSTTHRLYVVIGWIALIVVVDALALLRGDRILQQLHTAQLRRAARRGSPATQLPRAGRRPRPARLPRRKRQRPRSRRAPAHDRDLHADRTSAARRRRCQPLRRPGRRQGDLREPADRVRHDRLQRKSQPAARERAGTRRQGRRGGAPAGPADRARRPGDRGDRAGRLRPLHRRRADGRDRRAAAHVRLAARDGDADRHRARGSRHRPRRDRAVHARRRHPQLLLRARRDDRARRRDRLLAVHTDPLPRGLLPPRAHSRVGPRVGRPGDGHRGARRPVRRHDRRDRAARHDAAGRRLPLRRRDLGIDRSAVRDARRAHAAARADQPRRGAPRAAQPARTPQSRPCRRGQRHGGRRRRQRRARPCRRSDVAALEWLRAAARATDRTRRDAPHAPDRSPRARAATRLQRRQQRSAGHDHPPRLRAARGGLRPGLQRPVAGRRAPPPSR